MDVVDGPRDYYLFKKVFDSPLSGNKLPSNEQVFGRLYYLHKIVKQPFTESAIQTRNRSKRYLGGQC